MLLTICFHSFFLNGQVSNLNILVLPHMLCLPSSFCHDYFVVIVAWNADMFATGFLILCCFNHITIARVSGESDMGRVQIHSLIPQYIVPINCTYHSLWFVRFLWYHATCEASASFLFALDSYGVSQIPVW